ncbi:MAG: hypothetical protein LH491_05450 [Pseudoxanthomonas sp.]|nr:hypothetical protein [Pseudoxanthomonas sp.]
MAPPLPAQVAAAAQDVEHLRLLVIFHYLVAAMTALFSLFPVIHLAFGLGMVSGRLASNDPHAELVGWVLVGVATAFILGGLALAGFLAYAGRCLARRRRHTLCMVVACASCLLMPFGTVLGVFTLVVLTRPSVKLLFDQA